MLLLLLLLLLLLCRCRLCSGDNMDATMFQLRSFVHQRLYAAAEEILGQVERTLRTALYGAEPHAVKSPLINGAVTADKVLQETSTQPFIQEKSEIPGSSHTSTNTENRDGTYCLVQIDFKIKEEQEELGRDSQSQEVVSPPPEVVKTEKETHFINELPPVSSDDSAAQSENSDSDEEWMKSKKGDVLQRQNGSKKQHSQVALPDEDSSTKSHKDHSVCPVCGKGFQYIRPFMKHLKTHNRTCESTKELLSNLQSAHSKRLVCDVCGKTFTNPGCLHIHSKIHTGIKDFKCQDCGKSFVRKEHLTVHMRTHSGERPYHCDVCGRAFTQSQNLKVHRLTHSGEKRYQCGSCGKLFYTHGQLKKHMKHFSGDKGYCCDICGKMFCQRGQLTQHMGAHAGGSTE
ncbi:zinc finger protein 436-like [Echeneis naucrates]|uniref:zinc finger protein 436-like n=1 Tax=Echeneis naucrates TaxID=173247 RepID=UPI0011133F11|nr:zinc finger protein 436-like [Echeneis naucrates]